MSQTDLSRPLPEWQDSDLRKRTRLPANTVPGFHRLKPTEENEAVLTYLRDLAANWGQGHGLFLSGETGTGKSAIVQAFAYDVARTGKMVRFWNVADLFAHMRRDIRRQPNAYDGRDLEEADLVVFDDLDKLQATEWSTLEFFRLVDYRWREQRATFFTVNRDPDALSQQWLTRLGAEFRDEVVPLVDRMTDRNGIYQLRGASWRGLDPLPKRAYAEPLRFPQRKLEDTLPPPYPMPFVQRPTPPPPPANPEESR